MAVASGAGDIIIIPEEEDNGSSYYTTSSTFNVEDEKEQYLLEKFKCWDTLNPDSMQRKYQEVHEKLTENPEDPEAVAIMTEIFIDDFNQPTVEENMKHWLEMPRFTEMWGYLVQQMTMDLDAQNSEPAHLASLGMKIQFLTTLRTSFPNVKALRITGRGFDIDNRSLYIEYLDGIYDNSSGMKSLEFLDVRASISDTDLLRFVGGCLLAGTTLSEVRVSCKQFVYPKVKCDLPSVKKLVLYGFGYHNQNYPFTPAHIIKAFKNLKTLYMEKMVVTFVSGLIEFVVGINEKLPLQRFGVDSSAWKYDVGDKKDVIKITNIPTIRINLEGSIRKTSFNILDHVESVEEIILVNWDDDKLLRSYSSSSSLLENIMTTMRSKIPSAKRVVFLDKKKESVVTKQM